MTRKKEKKKYTYLFFREFSVKTEIQVLTQAQAECRALIWASLFVSHTIPTIYHRHNLAFVSSKYLERAPNMIIFLLLSLNVSMLRNGGPPHLLQSGDAFMTISPPPILL